MALSTFVIVSGINNLSDARYCAGMEVNQLGFNIEADHGNYTDPQKFKELSEWLSGVEFVGEITSSQADLNSILKEYALDAIQIENLNQIDKALKTDLKVSFKATSTNLAQEAWQLSKKRLDYVLIQNADIPKDELRALSLEMPLVLVDGFDNENLTLKLESIQPKGIAMQGGSEIRPGYKDFDELADILELLEIDDLGS